MHKITRVALGATFCLLTMLMIVPTRALSCKDVNIIFLRGSSQNYTPHNDEDVNFPVWEHTGDKGIQFADYRIDKTNDKEPAFVTVEKESAKYFKSLGDRIHLDYPKLSMQFVSLHDFSGKYNTNGYRAVSAFGSYKTAFVSKNAVDAKFGNYEIVADATGDQYRQSVSDGAEELAGYLQDQMMSCPSQYNVVGGFSQGAHVVGEAMQKMHDRGQDNLLSRLGHVDMYGDPKFNGFDLATSRLNPLQKHSTLPWTRGSATTNHAGSLGPRKPYAPDILTSKTTSWCDYNDIVCGGYAGLAINYDAHSEVYRADDGWIEQSANEIYVDLKTRLGLLAGITDKSANSPLAFWNGIKKPEKLDIMFVLDRTGDENISLLPDPEYIGWNVAYLAEKGFTSTQVGVVTYTEFSRFDGTKDLVESVVRTPTNLTNDIFSDYGYFRTSWGPAHFQNPPYGGEDIRDSPYSAISAALNQSWRKDARKVIVLFSNTWGKEKEDTTDLTMKQVAAKARSKNVEILPIFTSKTFRADESKVDFIPETNAFWGELAKSARGHATEVSGLIEDRLIYDVIMNHIHAPDVEISMGKTYNTPSASTKKAPASTTVKNTKPVVKTGTKVVLSASKSSSPKSKIKTYAWDLNGDGKPDVTGTSPDVENTYDDPYDGQVCVDVTDEEGTMTRECQDIGASDNDDEVTHEDTPILQSPVMAASRLGDDLQLRWNPVDGDITIADDSGAVMAVVDGRQGNFVLRNVPKTAFSLFITRHLGVDISEPVLLLVDADPSSNQNGGATSGGAGSTGGQTTKERSSGGSTKDIVLGSTSDSLGVLGAVVTNSQLRVSGGGEFANTAASRKGVTIPKIDISKVRNWTRAALAGLKYLMLIIAFAFWGNILALVLLIVLLLIILAIVSRDRDEKRYKYYKKHTFTQNDIRYATKLK